MYVDKPRNEEEEEEEEPHGKMQCLDAWVGMQRKQERHITGDQPKVAVRCPLNNHCCIRHAAAAAAALFPCSYHSRYSAYLREKAVRARGNDWKLCAAASQESVMSLF